MGKKVVIIGGVAAGASAAARLRRLDEDAQIIIVEKGEYISFANCGLPYYVGDVITKRSNLLVQTPGSMKKRFGIDVRTNSEAKQIFTDRKEIEILDINNEKMYRESYDYLLLSTGSVPVTPDLPGLGNPNVFKIRTVPDSDIIKQFIAVNKVRHGVVIGGGFIGLEMAEMLHAAGLTVHLVEASAQVFQGIDPEMAAFVHDHLIEMGINLYLNRKVIAMEGEEQAEKVHLDDGSTICADLAVLGIGVKPETALAQQAGLKIGVSGGIQVDKYLCTSDPYIYAAGDVIQVNDWVTGQDKLFPMAGPANRQGWIVANNIAGRQIEYQGVQGTAIVKLKDMTIACTGKNEKELRESGWDFLSCHVHPFSHATYYPGSTQMCVKLLFTPEKGKVLGAQIVGYDGVDKRIDVLATAIRAQMSIYDLQDLELAYAPPYSSAKDPVNMAAYTAANILEKRTEVVYWHEVQGKLNQGVMLIDVRTPGETAAGMVKGAVNIPLDEMRDRLDEIPLDKDIMLHCQVGLRSYVASRILTQKGYKAKNVSGGYRLYKVLERQNLL